MSIFFKYQKKKKKLKATPEARIKLNVYSEQIFTENR